MEVCVPYHRTKRREVVVRRFDGQSWSTLPTNLRRGSENHSSHPGGRPAKVNHKLRFHNIITNEINHFLLVLFLSVIQVIIIVRENYLFVPVAGMLLCEPVLLVYGCVPSSEGQLLCYTSWSPAGVQL